MFQDMDGSFLGSPAAPGSKAIAGGSLIGRFDTARVFPFDQGMPLSVGPCTYSPTTRGYNCFPNQASFVSPPMDPLLKVNSNI